MTIKEKYLAWQLEHQLHFVVRVGVDLHLHRVHVLVYRCFIAICKCFCTEIAVEKHFDPPKCDFSGFKNFSRLAIARHILGPPS